MNRSEVIAYLQAQGAPEDMAIEFVQEFESRPTSKGIRHKLWQVFTPVEVWALYLIYTKAS